MHFLRKELLAIILLLSLTLFISSYSNFVAEGNVISQIPSWAVWAGVPWDVTEPSVTRLTADFQNGRAVINADAHYIWRTGYIWNPTERKWKQFTFPQSSQYEGWASGSARAEIPLTSDDVVNGDNYVVAYTCQWKNERWYCGCLNENACSRWQLQTFTARKFDNAVLEDMGRYITNPGSVPDLQSRTASMAVPDNGIAGEPRADFTNDGRVDFDDFFMFADVFGSADSTYDLSNNGRVDFDDFFVFADNFGKRTLSSCSLLRTESECGAVPSLSNGVQCIWKGDTESSFCLAVSDSCSQLSFRDCGDSVLQGLLCNWDDASSLCVNFDPSTLPQGARLKTVGFGSSDEAYCPGFDTPMSWDQFYQSCPSGCVSYGGISSALFCVFPSGQYYTTREVREATASSIDYTNSCLSISSYCDCMSGDAEIEYCRRRQGSDGIYMRTLGDVHGCTWSEEPSGGFCTTVSQASMIPSATELGPREGQACNSAYSVRMGDGGDRNKCFACTPDGRWMQVQEKLNVIDPTICDAGMRVDAGIVGNFIGARMRESQLNTEALVHYQREVLPEMRSLVENSRSIDLEAKYVNDDRVYSERQLVGNDGQIIASINDGSLGNFDDFYYTDYGIIPKREEFRGCLEGSLCSAGSWTNSACLRPVDGACYVCSQVDDYSSRPGEGRDYNSDHGVYVGSVGVFMDHGTNLCRSMVLEGDGVSMEEVEFSSYENAVQSSTIRGLIEKVERGVYKVTFSTPQSYDDGWEITNYERTEEVITTTTVTRADDGTERPWSSGDDSNTLEFGFTMRRDIGTTTQGSTTYTRYEEYSFSDRDHDGRVEPEEFEYKIRLVSQDGSSSIDVLETSTGVSSERVSRIRREIDRQMTFAEERAREDG